MLGTSLRNIFAHPRGSKQSDAIRKARAQGALDVKNKRRLNVPDEKMGRGGDRETQS